MIIFITLLVMYFFENTPAKFEAQTIDDNVSIGYGLALGNVDGDGKADILLADKKQFVWYRNGDWKRFVMIDSLTEHDNVCIAARDIDGDGKVEVAVGAQWNPGETNDTTQSGSVHYLIRPEDPTQLWQAIELHHEPTVHRMKWVRSGGKYYLVVAPLHGRGNANGEGNGVKILAYEFPADVKGEWRTYTLDNNMHMTHNFDIKESSENGKTKLYIAGKEGIRLIEDDFDKTAGSAQKLPGMEYGAGEVRVGNKLVATIEPMHGDKLVAYLKNDNAGRIVLDSNLKEGHALALADISGNGSEQVVAGWRVPNGDNKVGIKLYFRNGSQAKWKSEWIDDNGMACEDLQVADLNGDGKLDIIASGRATKNLKIYWNK